MSLIRIVIIAGPQKRKALKAFFSNLSHVYKVSLINEAELERSSQILLQLQPDIILYSEEDQDKALRMLTFLKEICLKTEIVLFSESEDQEFFKKRIKGRCR